MTAPRVLFTCTYQGVRSRIAEEYAKRLEAGILQPFSASFEKGKTGPMLIAVMNEVGIDLPTESPKSLFEWYKANELFDHIICMCHEGSTEQCEILMTSIETLYRETAQIHSWDIPSFKAISGSGEDWKVEARKVRDLIRDEVEKFVFHYCGNDGKNSNL